ncbi:hypothetical protein CFLV_08365 [Corynebacterium flavescens]|uniref:Uncharacterized protein n=1 Tax=Corynebacterium flavescens TaxID=28028 RepID=A0A1L7CMY3_CORFL|nr:hypothetical protein CFLV_08365 [Corynebacterium flavescens]
MQEPRHGGAEKQSVEQVLFLQQRSIEYPVILNLLQPQLNAGPDAIRNQEEPEAASEEFHERKTQHLG